MIHDARARTSPWGPTASDRPRASASTIAWAAVPLLLFVALYARDVGAGFVKDDFRWIADARAATARSWWSLFQVDNGFYRPLVSLSFALDDRLFRVDPFPYGVTNLCLALACGGLVYALFRALGARHAAACLGMGTWLLTARR